MSFIKELDVVSIFANLIDNAFESCELSKEKKMYLSINTFNESYLAIRMDNSSDCQPKVIEGRLQTHKLNKNTHGIGMSSMERALKNYSGSLKWEYNQNTHMFSTIMLMNRKERKI